MATRATDGITIMANKSEVQPGILGDQPVSPWMKFSGYTHKKDPTLLPNNVLTYPSVNCMMPDGDKVIPRAGSKLLGQDGDQIGGMIGHYKKFQNVSGIEMEVRVWNDPDGEKVDVIEVLYEDEWRQITENVNPLTKGISRLGYQRIYFFTQWIDTNLDPSLSINTNRLIWVMGLAKVRSWTGGIATVGAVTPTSISTVAGITWTSLGFDDPIDGGSAEIIVNGKSYTVSSGWGTDILVIADTTGISSGDFAFSGIQEVDAPTVFDYISQFKNYVCYGNWFLQKFWMANNFNRPAEANITNAQAVQNDLVLGTSPYTGMGSHVYRVTIDSISPDQDIQTFVSGGQGNLNDGVYDTSAYSGTAGQNNIYDVIIVSNLEIIFPTSQIVGGPFLVGDTVLGSVSMAEGIITAIYVIGSDTTFAIRLTTVNSFRYNDTLQCLREPAGATSVVNPLEVINHDVFSYLKNGAIIALNIGTGLGPQNANPLLDTPITLTDGLTIQFGQVFGHATGDDFKLTISKNGADTFQWQIDGAVPVATMVPITGISQALSDGISITFVSKTGHTLGDYWEITADQDITIAYANFYFSSNRKPGEGYIGQLPANFWTMAPQEDDMYVNDATGKWGYIETTLSADLLNESVNYVPLKQPGANKVIFPFMIGYLDNNLAYVTEGKWLDMIGRKKLIELPQTGHLSDPVKYDFLAASFENGSIEFNDMQLSITSPKDLLMFVYDLSQVYWQPPQIFQENGILSVVGNQLISHSNLKNRTNTLYIGTNDNGAAYPIKIRTGYNTYGNRWQVSKASMAFMEGYVQGNPNLIANILQNVNGCKGIQSATVVPITCIASDKAPIGYGSLGSHSLGSDEPIPILPYFQWIGAGQTPFTFYMAAFDVECESLDPQFQILSLGLNTVASDLSNALLKKNQGTLVSKT